MDKDNPILSVSDEGVLNSDNGITESVLCDLSELYKVFGDLTRIKILFALLNDEVCVQDLAKSLYMSVSAVSHQLKTLKQSKLIKFRKEGKNVYYSLADDHVKTIISQGLDHVTE